MTTATAILLKPTSLTCFLALATIAPLSGAVTDAAGELHSTSSGAAASSDDLASKLANPLAAMISVPFQNNFDFGAGPNGDGFQWKMNIQPVMPFSLNKDWNLIVRTIIPVISQDDIAGTKANPSGSQTGLGDAVMSAWLSPTAPTSNGWIWGVGGAFLLPTGTDSDNFLGNNQWAVGPTAIALRTQGKFTYGCLVNHLWNVGGDAGRPATNATFVQPFVSYLPGGGWTYSLNTESTYNWEADQWTVPINLAVSKMIKIGKMPANWQLGVRYYPEKPDQGPEWGIRAGLTFLFPKS